MKSHGEPELRSDDPRQPPAAPTTGEAWQASEDRAGAADRAQPAGAPETGRLEGIWIKRFRGAPLDAIDHASVRAGHGIDGNASHGRLRQVTLLEREAWEQVAARLGRPVDPATRRANLWVSGVSLADSRGRKIAIGDVRVLIHGETRPCHLMDEAAAGLRAAMSEPWAGGAFGEVCNDGEIRVGDAVRFVEPDGSDGP